MAFGPLPPSRPPGAEAVRNMGPAAGFTLVEVLVALGMVAVALAAGNALQASLVRRAEREPQALLAEVCARNQFAALRLLRTLPPPGEERSRCPQAGREFELLTTVSATASADFRQVRVQVSEGGQPLMSLATVLGRY